MKNAELWKRILNEGLNAPSNPDVEGLENLILTSQIIVDTRPVDRECKAPQLMPIAVPFEAAFIEMSLQLVGTTQVDPDGNFRQIDYPERLGRLGALVRAKKNNDGWGVRMDCVGSEPLVRPNWFGAVLFTLDHSGRPSTKYTNILPARFESVIKAAEEQIRGARFAVCDTLAMLSCKNVSLSPRDNDPKQVARAIKRHGGNPDKYRYHVLVVRPAGAKSDSPAQEIGIMPRHVCRGHFSEYGPEFGKGLLFGKYAGRFFIPPHMKGDKKNGVVEKDYELPPDSPQGDK